MRATEWEIGGKPLNRLLSGTDITAAKAWALRRPKGAPEPTSLHLEFIRASEEAQDERLREQRKQLEDMATAQQEREKALRSAEDALARTIRLKRRQAWAGAVTIAVLVVIGWWANGVIQAQREVAHQAAREDIRGQIVAYAAAFGTTEMDVVEGLSTSPYTTPLVQKLRQKKNVVEAIVDAHKYVPEGSHNVQRPLLSTTLNGQIYLYRQPATRRKCVMAISVEAPGAGVPSLEGPPHDVAAFVSTLQELGFSGADTIILRNPDRREIEATIDSIKQSFRRQADVVPRMSHQELFVRVGLKLEPTPPPAAPDNTLFVLFFSGHGVHIGDKDYIVPRLSPHIETVVSPADVEKWAVNGSWLRRPQKKQRQRP